MNAGWDNLIPKEKKYTPQLAASAAKMLEDGKSLTLTARTHNVSRTTLRNWASTDPTLQRAFEVFEANKLGAELERERVGHFKNIARNIVENAKQGVPDPIGKALGKPAAPAQPEPPKPTPETRHTQLQQWWASDWTQHHQNSQAEQSELEKQTEVQGFWV
tara:strand:+ start:136 stop:618 length:483 start_codon:yes stop_codon:yes gene_type:complete